MKEKHNKTKISGKMMLESYKLFFGTLSSNIRLRIINELRKKPMTVSELIDKLSIEQTAMSHNIARLKRCGFVNVEKKGKFRLYSLNSKTIKPLMEIIDDHMEANCLQIIGNKLQNKCLDQ